MAHLQAAWQWNDKVDNEILHRVYTLSECAYVSKPVVFVYVDVFV